MIWALYGLLLVIVAFAFWQLWLLYIGAPEWVAKLKTLSWQSLKKRQIFQLTMELPLYLLAFITFVWVQRRLRGSRLYLSNSQLRHSSGLPPWLGNLLNQNWTLALDEFRSGRRVFTLAGMARSNALLAWFSLKWKAGNDRTHWLSAYLMRRQLSPASCFWLAAEHAPTEPSFKPTQGLIAALFGVSAALIAPPALLGLNLASGTRQGVSVTVSKTPLQILPEDKNIPPFSPSQAKEFWAELPAQPARQIAVHKGIFGSWQYDSGPLEDEVAAFYKKYHRPARPPKT